MKHACGNCKHMMHEDADGYCICEAFDTIVHCSEPECQLYERR